MNTRASRYALIAVVGLTSMGTWAQSSYPSYLSTAEIPVKSSDGFNRPQGLALAPDGTLYVADAGNGRVLKIAPDGTQSTVNFGSLNSVLSSPTGLALDSNGNLFVSDPATTLILEVPAKGVPIKLVGLLLTRPTSIAVDAAGDLAIVDSSNGTLSIKPNGGTQRAFNSGSVTLADVTGVAFDATGNLYVTDGGDDNHPTAIYRFSKLDGTGTATNLTPTEYNPQYLANLTVDSQNNVFVLDGDTEQLIEIPASGVPAFLVPQSSFREPSAVIADPIGNLYVSGAGRNADSITKYAYYNAANFGSVPVGSSSASITVNFEFYKSTTIKSIRGFSGGKIGEYTRTGGTCGLSTYAPTHGSVTLPATCNVIFKLTPSRVGARPGAIELATSNGTESQAVYGIGQGSLLAIDYAPLSVRFPGVIKHAVAVAVDAIDAHVYVADTEKQGVFVAPIGSYVLTQINTGVPTPAIVDIKLDGAGNLYVLNQSPAEIIKVPTDGTTPSVLNIDGLVLPQSFAIDPNGTFYIADANTWSHDAFILQVTASGAATKVPIGFGSGTPISIASDTTGALWIATAAENSIVKITPGAWTITDLDLQTFDAAYIGVSTDASNSLYYIEAGSNSVVVSGSGTNSTPFIQLVDNGLLDGPSYTATSPSGKLYLIDGGQVKLINRTAAQASSISPGAVLWNIGNLDLLSTDPDNLYTESGNGVGLFTISPGSDHGCQLGTVAKVGAYCTLTTDFTPTGPGTFADTLHFLTNANNTTTAVLKLTGTK